MDDFGLLNMLAAGGDVATLALVGILWRFDRRILVIETFIANLKEKKHEKMA